MNSAVVRYRMPHVCGYGSGTRLSTALSILGFSKRDRKEMRCWSDGDMTDAVHRQFIEMSKIFHPDVTGDDAVQKQLSFAYHRAKHLISRRSRDYVDVMDYAVASIS